MSVAASIQLFTADPAAAATPILVDALSPPFTAPPVTVRLLVDVLQHTPQGWPSPPDQTGTGAAEWYERTIPSGTTLKLFACVAAALIAANAAVQV